MLYVSLHVPEGQTPYDRSVLDLPDLSKYYIDWGREKDIALVAEIDNELIAAAWGRLFTKDNPGYGYVDEQTPEIAIAVKEEYRNLGIGGKLIDALVKKYSEAGIHSVSLSVDKSNRAANLYYSKGFTKISDQGTSLTMIKLL